MPISYNPSTNIITVTGFSSSSPCTFEDIYQADVNGGWGVVSKQNIQYEFNCGLEIGNGTEPTWFKDCEKQVRFLVANVPISGTTQYKAVCAIRNGANMQLGEVYDTNSKIGWQGCHVVMEASNAFGFVAEGTANLYLYGCCVKSPRIYGNGSNTWGGHDGALVVWDCHFDGSIYIATPNHDISRNYVNHWGYGNVWLVSGVSAEIDSPQAFGGYGTYNGAFGFIFGQGTNVKIKNCFARRNQRLVVEWGGYGYGNRYFVNADTDTWEIQWNGQSDSVIYRQYTFDLQCLRKDGSGYAGLRVKLYDVDGQLVVDTTTDSEGKIAQQEVTFGYYDYPHRPNIVLKTPHTLEIYDGTLKIYSGTLVIDRKTSLVLHLPFDVVHFSGIIEKWQKVLAGRTIKVKFVSASGSSVKIYVYKPDGGLCLSDTMAESAIGGVYEYDLTIDSAWGEGVFLIKCVDEDCNVEDYGVCTVVPSDEWYVTQQQLQRHDRKMTALKFV